MNAIDLLVKDHQGAKKVMGEISASTGAKKKELFTALKGELELHDHIEEKIFYPAVTAHPKGAALSAGDLAAHKVVEGLLAQLSKLAIEDPAWTPKFDTMKADLLRHIADEEGNLFVKIRQVLSTTELEALGVKMMAEKDRKLKVA
jgi:iron-sulfur cluster repair protein YtfE (RIC family)